MPEWLKDVNIDLDMLSKEVDTMMFVEEIQDHERFIASFVGKINEGVQQRQTQLARMSMMKFQSNDQFTPEERKSSVFKDTIAKFQDFFGGLQTPTERNPL